MNDYRQMSHDVFYILIKTPEDRATNAIPGNIYRTAQRASADSAMSAGFRRLIEIAYTYIGYRHARHFHAPTRWRLRMTP